MRSCTQWTSMRIHCWIDDDFYQDLLNQFPASSSVSLFRYSHYEENLELDCLSLSVSMSLSSCFYSSMMLSISVKSFFFLISSNSSTINFSNYEVSLTTLSCTLIFHLLAISTSLLLNRFRLSTRVGYCWVELNLQYSLWLVRILPSDR